MAKHRFVCGRVIIIAFLLLGTAWVAWAQPTKPDATGYANVTSGTTVSAVSEGVNPPPYDVRAALGDGEHLSYTGALPNWFELDLGQVRSIRAVEIDWRYDDKSADDFNLSFGTQPGQWHTTLPIRGIGGQGRYWFRVLEAPVEARYVRLEVQSLHNYQWTVLNRFSLYGSSRIPRLVTENADRYAWLSGRLQQLASATRDRLGTVPASLRAANNAALQYDSLLRSKEDISDEQWRTMGRSFRSLQQQAYDAEAHLSFQRLRGHRDASVAIGAVGAMTRVYRDIWPEDATSELRLYSARNERESGQVVLAAVTEDLRNVRVSVDPLRGPVTLENAVEPGLVCYVRTVDAPYLTHHLGLWPDGISPLAPFNLPRGQVQPIWLTVAIPAEAPAGEYSTVVRIAAEGMAEQSIPVRVSVWHFALPQRISLPNVFSLSSLLTEAWFRDKKLSWEQLKDDYYDFWLQHRLNPTSLYGQMLPPATDLDRTLAGGMNAFVINYLRIDTGPLEEERFQRTLGELAEWDAVLAERDLYDKAIVYLADEPAEKAPITAEINRRAQIIKERFPRMQRMIVLTRPVDRAFDGNVDIWCPIVPAMKTEDIAEAHKRGEKCWWYSVGHFFDLDIPTAAARSMPWLSFKHNLEGILYWTIQSSWRDPNRPATFRPQPGNTIWEDFDPAGHAGHNGIGNLCYPGSDGRPWSSQRLEILRDGMEDYEYLILLRKALETSPRSPYHTLLKVPDQFAAEYEVGTDPSFILKQRQAIGQALNDLMR